MPVKYFARINRRQVGPLTLQQLLQAGVRPTSYVWCKGMPDWQPAAEVPDICRAMRRALAGLDPETGAERNEAVSGLADTASKISHSRQPATRQEMAEYLREAFNEAEEASRPDYSHQPQGVSIVMAIMLTICCFPLTGLISIYFAWRCRRNREQSQADGLTTDERDSLRRKSHDDARLYRMMAGITFSMGIIMAGMALSRYML